MFLPRGVVVGEAVGSWDLLEAGVVDVAEAEAEVSTLTLEVAEAASGPRGEVAEVTAEEVVPGGDTTTDIISGEVVAGAARQEEDGEEKS